MRVKEGAIWFAPLFAEILRLNSACESENRRNRRSSPSLERRVRVTLVLFRTRRRDKCPRLKARCEASRSKKPSEGSRWRGGRGIAELAPYLRGWRSYFGFCETPDELMYLTRWVRLRLRAAMWRQWKTPRRRRAALLSLGSVRDSPITRLAVGVALGIWLGPRPSPLGFPMLTSNRSAFRR
jgi:hypothetical protein